MIQIKYRRTARNVTFDRKSIPIALLWTSRQERKRNLLFHSDAPLAIAVKSAGAPAHLLGCAKRARHPGCAAVAGLGPAHGRPGCSSHTEPQSLQSVHLIMGLGYPSTATANGPFRLILCLLYLISGAHGIRLI